MLKPANLLMFFYIFLPLVTMAADPHLSGSNLYTLPQIVLLLETAGVNVPDKDNPDEVFLVLEKAINTDCPRLLRSLKGGERILRLSVKLEEYCKKNNYTIWWRFSQDLQKDIETGNNPSLGLCLLGGYINDGCEYFAGNNDVHCEFGYLGFSSACSYIYWRNAHFYNTREYVSEQFNFIGNVNHVIRESNAQKKYEERALNSKKWEDECSAHRDLGFDETGYLDGETFLLMNSEYSIALKKEFENLFPATEHIAENLGSESKLDALRKLSPIVFTIYDTDDTKIIMPAMAGTLYIFPMPVGLEKMMLSEICNHEVDKNANLQLSSKGETFHPRIFSDKLKKYQSKLIKIYDNGSFIDEGIILAELDRIFSLSENNISQ